MLPFEELRLILLAKRDRLLAQVSRVEDDLHGLDANVETEPEEEAQETSIAQLLTRLDDLGRTEVAAIDHALSRIASDEYGRCESCGAPIPIARLRALPTAPTCISCAR